MSRFRSRAFSSSRFPFRIPKTIAGIATLAGALAVSAVFAQAHTDKEAKEDIARHRAMAAAHESAAKCLESGKTEEICMKELLAACKGLAIGKYCGMKHVH